MSGSTCADFGANKLKTENGPLCLMPPGFPYAGVLTYPDGRVATLADGQGNQDYSTDPNQKLVLDAQKTRDLNKTELGSCRVRDGAHSLSFLPASYKGTPVAWTAADLREVYRVIGQSEGQSDNAFFCVNVEDQGRIALNNDVAHQPALRAAIDTLEKDHGKLDDLHYHALRASLYIATGQQEPHSASFLDKLKEYWPLALLFGIQGPVQLYHLIKALIGRKNPPDGPSSGNKGGGGGSGRPLETVMLNGVPHWVNNGEVIGPVRREATEDGVISGTAGENVGNDTVLTPLPDFVHNWDEEPTREWVALPEGVVTPDEGSLIYDPKYQAFLDGKIIALPPDSGLTALAGGSYSYAEFLERVHGLSVSAAAPAAPLNLKGPSALTSKYSGRIANSDEAAAVAADRMRSGTAGGPVTGFGVQGGSIGVEAPVVRVVPVPVAVP